MKLNNQQLDATITCDRTISVMEREPKPNRSNASAPVLVANRRGGAAPPNPPPLFPEDGVVSNSSPANSFIHNPSYPQRIRPILDIHRKGFGVFSSEMFLPCYRIR